MALRTIPAPDLTKPRKLDPPFREAVPDATTPTRHSEPWNAWFTQMADRATELTDAAAELAARLATAVIMQSGTSTSSPAGAISVTLPVPYGVRTLGFQVDARPGHPDAFFNQGTVQSLPLDVITGTLSHDTGGGTIVAVPNAPFTWFATGV